MFLKWYLFNRFNIFQAQSYEGSSESPSAEKNKISTTSEFVNSEKDIIEKEEITPGPNSLLEPDQNQPNSNSNSYSYSDSNSDDYSISDSVDRSSNSNEGGVESP